MSNAAIHPRRLAALAGTALLVVGLFAWGGLSWWHQLPHTATVIEGAHHASEDDLLALIGTPTGGTLYDLPTDLIADRVVRHPWVADATVQRRPTGALRVVVRERTPVALVMTSKGAPDYYLDAAGYAMPLVSNAAYHVPLLWRVPDAYHPVRPVQTPDVRAVLATLSTMPPDVDALISDVERRSADDWWVHTAPPPGRAAIPVQLGAPPLDDKLSMLHRFWHQAVLSQPSTHFERVDVRFNQQVITEESKR